ncbi:kinase-like domain-containing protein, partial [Phakopsora pachyrhizi]
PLTPRTSPYNQISPKCPQLTSSAKTLNSHKLDADFRENFVLGDELGCGGFGFVVRATRIKDGLSCAVKFIYKEKIPSHGWVQDDYRRGEEGSNYNKRAFGGNKMIPLEAYVLKKINHRGVVRFVDLYEDSKLIYLVMEHHGTPWAVVEKENKGKKISPSNLGGKVPTISSLRKSPLQPSTNEVINTTSPKSVNFNESIVFGESSIHSGAQQSQLYAPIPPITRRSSCDLFECIELHSRLPEKHAKFIFAQLVDIVGNLHYNGFVHRDIKDENIVVDQNFRVKLIDFGSALTFDFSREISPVKKFYGTMNFASPEIAVGGFYHPIAAEVWSLGVLLSILVCGESVFRDLDSIKAYNPARPKFPISESCMDLISRCLALAPEKRWNCFKIRSHPWL